MITNDVIDNVSKQAINEDGFREILSNHFDGLDNDVVISLGINFKNTKIEDVVNLLRKNGIDAVPFYSERVKEKNRFVVDDTGIKSPCLSAKDSLEYVKDVYNILSDAGIDIIGYALPMDNKNLVDATPPNGNRQIKVTENADEMEFIADQLKQVKDMDEVIITEEVKKGSLFRGGTLGNQAYGVTGSRCARNVCYASDNFKVASDYADGGFSVGVGYVPVDGKKYGFIYEFDTNDDYIKYPMYGIEHRRATENNDEMYETPVFVHKNPLKAVYLKFGDKTVLIADEQGYIDENWEKFANLHNPKSITEKNDMMIERVNNIKSDFNAVNYEKKEALLDEDVLRIGDSIEEQLKGFVFDSSIALEDGVYSVRDLNASYVSLPDAFKSVSFVGNLRLNNVSGLEGDILDLSKCNGDISLANIDLSNFNDVVFPKECKNFYLENVKLPEGMKSLGVEKCDNFILFNQDLSNLDEFSIPKVSGKTRFWGDNVMPQTVDTSNVSNIDEKSEINNLNFDKTQNIIINRNSSEFFMNKKIEIMKKALDNSGENKELSTKNNVSHVSSQTIQYTKSKDIEMF